MAPVRGGAASASVRADPGCAIADVLVIQGAAGADQWIRARDLTAATGGGGGDRARRRAR
jgi:hypothetical protein